MSELDTTVDVTYIDKRLSQVLSNPSIDEILSLCDGKLEDDMRMVTEGWSAFERILKLQRETSVAQAQIVTEKWRSVQLQRELSGLRITNDIQTRQLEFAQNEHRLLNANISRSSDSDGEITIEMPLDEAAYRLWETYLRDEEDQLGKAWYECVEALAEDASIRQEEQNLLSEAKADTFASSVGKRHVHCMEDHLTLKRESRKLDSRAATTLKALDAAIEAVNMRTTTVREKQRARQEWTRTKAVKQSQFLDAALQYDAAKSNSQIQALESEIESIKADRESRVAQLQLELDQWRKAVAELEQYQRGDFGLGSYVSNVRALRSRVKNVEDEYSRLRREQIRQDREASSIRE